jgi:hypothetical protein
VGLRAGLDALGPAARPGERRLIIFLTDGLFDANRSNEAYYTTDEGRALLERARGQRGFAERPCARSYARLVPHVEAGFLAQMDVLTSDLRASGVRLYTVGLGSDLGSASADAERSRAMLRRLATSTGGALLVATAGAQLPGFFASIYSALVGAPAEDPVVAPAGADAVSFAVLRGARRAAVIVDAAGARDLEVAVEGPAGPVKGVLVRSFHADTAAAPGYRVLELDAPAAGTWTVRRAAGTAPLAAQVIQEVGLRLALDGLPEVAPEGTIADLSVALRTSAGDPVRLSPEFLGQIEVTAAVGPVGGRRGERTVRLDRAAEASLGRLTLTPGEWTAGASARHALGLLDVAPVERRARVVRQIELAFAEARLVFDVMAEVDAPPLAKGVEIALAPGAELPVEQEFRVSWSEVEGLDLLDHGPTEITLGPARRSVPVEVRLAGPRELRAADRRFRGKVWVTPVSTELFRGAPRWSAIDVDGRLRPWDWRRWYREYATWIWSGAAAFLVFLWLLGRLVAAKWPKKATLHYVDREDRPPTEMTVRLGRASRSHLPFRADRHACGRGGAPNKRGKVRWCTLVAAGRGFRVVPGSAGVAVVGDDGVPAGDATRQPFAGKWDQRYRLGDRYEIWLTRT